MSVSYTSQKKNQGSDDEVSGAGTDEVSGAGTTGPKAEGETINLLSLKIVSTFLV